VLTGVSALVGAVGALVDAAIDRVLLSELRVTSAAEAKRLLAQGPDTEVLADKVQRVVVLAVPLVRVLARGARFSRVPWAVVASSSVSIGAAVRAGVRELQLLASLVTYQLEQAAEGPADRVLVKKLAVDLYLEPSRTPDLSDETVHLVRLTRRWVLGGAFGRNTATRALQAFDAAERLDYAALNARWHPIEHVSQPAS